MLSLESVKPPYSKYHILAFGSVTLLLSMVALFLIKDSSPTNQGSTSKPITAQELQQEFSQPLAMAQQDQAIAAWTVEKFVIFDLRSVEDYEANHLIGAENIAAEDLEGAILDPQVDMILYSTNPQDLAKAGAILEQKNIRQIRLLSEPLDTLKQQGYKLSADL